MKKKFIRIFFIEIIIVISIFMYLYMNFNTHNTLAQNNVAIYTDEELEVFGIKKSKLYSEIEKALLAGQEQITLGNLSLFKDPKEIFIILEEISNENPEVLYYKGAEYKLGNLKLYYSKEKDEINSHRDDIRRIRNEFISNNISPKMSEFEKILVIHDYIINNTRYDERLANEGMVPPESYSTYGVLSLGIGVCEGYAKAMKYLLDAAGVDSIIVIGESKGESHAWNLVKIEEEYYHIDSTWDDPITMDESDILRYNFFNLNDEEISKTHNWDRDNYPNAKGDRYNYYSYNNLTVYGKYDLEKKLKNALLKRYSKISIKINNYNNESIYFSEIVENIAYENYEIIELNSYTYSFDKDYGIVNFEFFYNLQSSNFH